VTYTPKEGKLGVAEAVDESDGEGSGKNVG
jgi:hypothetical protein